jgi:hypothetical protein
MTKTDNNKQPDQRTRLLKALRAAGPLGVTAMQALDQGGMYRAGARIYELRKLGYNISTERRLGQTAKYRLEDSVTAPRRES